MKYQCTMHIYIYIYTYIYIYIHTYIHTCIYIWYKITIHHRPQNDSIHTYPYIYIYISLYTYIYTHIVDRLYIQNIHVLYTHTHMQVPLIFDVCSVPLLWTQVAIPASGPMSRLGVGSSTTSQRSKCNACGTRMSKQAWAGTIHQKWRFQWDNHPEIMVINHRYLLFYLMVCMGKSSRNYPKSSKIICKS